MRCGQAIGASGELRERSEAHLLRPREQEIHLIKQLNNNYNYINIILGFDSAGLVCRFRKLAGYLA